jgi:hypothetical protein
VKTAHPVLLDLGQNNRDDNAGCRASKGGGLCATILLQEKNRFQISGVDARRCSALDVIRPECTTLKVFPPGGMLRDTGNHWNAIRHNVVGFYRMICNAKDLSPDQKAAIETLLGRRIQEDEAVSVRTFEPVVVSHQRRLEIANELRKYFAEVDAARKPVSEEEAEDIITEAMRSVRPGYRPHQ